MTLILRSVKNAELEWQEVDGNFVYLENKIDELEQLVGGNEVLRVTAQEFLPEQQARARANILAVDFETVQGIDERVVDLESLDMVLYAEQSATPEQKQFLRDNADVYSKTEVDDAIAAGVSPSLSIKNITVTEEGQAIVPDANKTIVRFNNVFPECTIQPALNNGDELTILNKAVTETGYVVNMPVILQDSSEAAFFTVAPNKNYRFLFELAINKWIDVSL